MDDNSAYGAPRGAFAHAPTGFRRMTPGLLKADRAAESFAGLPEGVRSSGQLLAALKAAAPRLAGLRRLAGSRGVKCLFFGDPTGKGRHYSGVGGGLGEAVIFGLDWSGRSNLSL